MTSVKQRVKIKEPWVPEIFIDYDQEEVRCNLVNIKTGGIRQVRVDFDTAARRLFGSRIKTTQLNGYEPILTEKVK